MAVIEFLHESETAKKQVIFIHGLGGDLRSTWSTPDSNKKLWPLWLKDDINDLNIITIGYDSPVFSIFNTGMGIYDRAQNILERLLLEERIKTGEIIFIGHSLGGLIIKKIILLADNKSGLDAKYGEFIHRVTRIAFLATPHLGSDVATTANHISKHAVLSLLNPSAFTASLSRNDPGLRELNTTYRNFCHDKAIEHLILMETKNTGYFFQVVKPDSADPGLRNNAIPVDANHVDVCKPKSKSCEIYIHICGFIKKELISPQKLWLQKHFGLQHCNWQGYENWAADPNGIEGEYLLDSKLRLQLGSANGCQNIEEGINYIRNNILSKKIMRLVGLSGVGKTRFLQALFDERIGTMPLDKECVFYTNITENLANPNPETLLRKLIETNRDAIMIIDNCSAQTHRELSEILPKSNLKIALITVEYDIRDDFPENTEVLRLEPASPELLQTLIQKRYNLPDILTRRIAKLAEGNARIATLLASNVENEKDSSILTDDELFKRLFVQRHENNPELENAAQVLSLVYSYKIEEEDGYSDDLQLMSKLSEITEEKLYRASIELKRRQLTQQRARWMAVLPHPIANRLAASMLGYLPEFKIKMLLNAETDERFLKSFSRRLGYLNSSEEAKQLAQRWLEDGGLLDTLLENANGELWIQVLSNTAPIIQKETFEYLHKKIEKPFEAIFAEFENTAQLLRSLAYEEKMFPKSVKLLIILAKQSGNVDSIVVNILASLFSPYLSGTHAPLEMRLDIIKELIQENNVNSNELALKLLAKLLSDPTYCTTFSSFDFGLQSRDFGYEPTIAELFSWYKTVIDYSIPLLKENDFFQSPLKDEIADIFKMLWREDPDFHGYLKSVAKEIYSTGEWSAGWLAISSLIQNRTDEDLYGTKNCLCELKKSLEPKSLPEELDFFVFTKKHIYRGLKVRNEKQNDIEFGYEKMPAILERLGQETASEDVDFIEKSIKRALYYKTTNCNMFFFGKGFAKKIDNRFKIWEVFKTTIKESEDDKVRSDFIAGFVNETQTINPQIGEILLDELLANEKINFLFPEVQIVCKLDAKAIERFKIAITKDIAPISKYNTLAYGQRLNHVEDADIISLLELFRNKENSQNLILEILFFVFYQQENVRSEALLRYAWNFLYALDYSQGFDDYQISKMLQICIDKLHPLPNIDKFLKNTIIFLNKEHRHLSHPEHILEVIFNSYASEFLDILLAVDDIVFNNVKSSIRSSIKKEKCLFGHPSVDNLLAICKKNPDRNYLRLAKLINPFIIIDEKPQWSPLALKLLELSPDPNDLLCIFECYCRSGMVSGSHSGYLAQYSPLFESLIDHPNENLSCIAKRHLISWQKKIERTRQEEIQEEYDNQSFE